jgi:stringent starvation protein B
MSQNRLPPKKDVALALLESSTVFLHLDPRVEEVKVPPWFKRQPQLVLQIGLNMPVPIHDLNLDDVGVSCTLSFNRMPHFCHVPWKAIYALVAEDGRGMLWPEDIPPEVSAQAQVRAQTQESRSRLHAVPAVAAKRTAEARPEPIRPGSLSRDNQRADAAQPAKKRARRKPRREETAATGRTGRNRRPALAPVEPPKPARPAAQASGSKTSDEAPRKKRELPPYLRVVK